jgi:hypothetical protein
MKIGKLSADRGSGAARDATHLLHLTSPADRQPNPTRILEVQTRSGPVRLSADEVVEVTASRVGRAHGLPPWALGLASVGQRDVVVIEPDRLHG